MAVILDDENVATAYMPGYDEGVPMGLHPMTYIFLHQLAQHGQVELQHDDGEGVIVRSEVKGYSQFLGLEILSEEPYSMWVQHYNFKKKILRI